MPVRVKICGITHLDDARAAVDAGADALGFILYEKSKRFIAIERALEIVEQLPPFVTSVAVTVNAVRSFTNLSWRKQLKQFNVAQLHGRESAAHGRAVSKYLPVIKALPADEGMLFEIPAPLKETMHQLSGIQKRLEQEKGTAPSAAEIAEAAMLPIERVTHVLRFSQRSETTGSSRDFESIASAFLLDTPSPDHGGTGRTFDWELAAAFKQRTRLPLILSGGLTDENVTRAIDTVRPYGVDVSSGVESSPGRKDHAKMRAFIRQAQSA